MSYVNPFGYWLLRYGLLVALITAKAIIQLDCGLPLSPGHYITQINVGTKVVSCNTNNLVCRLGLRKSKAKYFELLGSQSTSRVYRNSIPKSWRTVPRIPLQCINIASFAWLPTYNRHILTAEFI